MRLMIACRALDNMAGGVERQAIALADEMSARGHKVCLISWDQEKAQSFYELPAAVEWHKIDLGNPGQKAGWVLRLQRMKKVRKAVRDFKPDIILAFQQGMFLSMRLYTMGMNAPVIAAERESPYRYDHVSAGRYRYLIFQTFRLAHAMTVQCEGYVEAYPDYLRSKIHVIPNPVFPAKQQASPAGEKGQERTLLCVARLGYAKNQQVLIEAFANLAGNFPEWNLVLAGEGEQRQALDKQIKNLSLQDRVSMPGAVKDVDSLYAKSHLFCLPSRWEGFPNALAEAMAHGLPCVGYKECGGVRDLIEGGRNGVLAEGNGHVTSLTQALETLMAKDDRRAAMGAAAKLSVEKYDPCVIYDLWERFLKKAAFL